MLSRAARSALPVALIVLTAASSRAAAPARVQLEVKAGEEGAPRGGLLPVDVFAHIERGWHIHSHQPTEPFLIATELTVTVPPGVVTEEVFYPPPDRKKFAFAGDVELEVYEGKLGLATAVRVPSDYSGERIRIEAALRYQACNDTSCLPPATARAETEVAVVDRSSAALDEGGDVEGAGASKGGAPDGARFARWLTERGLAFTLAAVALLGLGLNLTPCVYPLISVTVAYFGGQAHERSRVALLATLYVVGVALSFSAVGVGAALSGGLFGAALQKPAVVVFLASVMVALALSSFGLYQLRPPGLLMRVAGTAGSGAAGALFMGLTMGVVAAPCVGPIVLGLLVFVGSRQDPLLGFLLFFFLALGMGAPYLGLALAADSIRHLPRSGEWLMWTERLFGCVLLSLAAYFLAPILPAPLDDWLLPATVALSGLYLGFVEPAGQALRYFPLVKRGAGVVLMGGAVWLGQASGAPDAVAWEPIAVLANDGAGGARPLLIDFAAEWCIPCREMERSTYADAALLREAERFRMVKADITEENDQTSGWVEKYEVRGVPTVILFSAGGEERQRFVGYVGAGELIAAMKAVP